MSARNQPYGYDHPDLSGETQINTETIVYTEVAPSHLECVTIEASQHIGTPVLNLGSR